MVSHASGEPGPGRVRDTEESPDLHLLEERLAEVLGRGTRLQPTPSWLRLGAEDRPAPLDVDEAVRLRNLLSRLRDTDRR